MNVAVPAMAILAAFFGRVAAAETDMDGESPAGWFAALRHGDLRLHFRYRFEHFDDDSLLNPAKASTLRSRITYRSAAWRRWSILLEADDVQAIGNDLYNSTRNGETGRPVVPDPEGSEINQAALQYSASRHSFVFGRQRLNFDNQRFVGSSAWRQNEQTYDAVTARARLERTDLVYSYVANVNRPVGPRDGEPAADLRGHGHLLNARHHAGRLGSVTAFAYALDFDNAASLSSRTLGVRWTGTYRLGGELRATQAASFARQSDAGGNPVNFTADYWQVEAGLKLREWSLSIGRECLEGDSLGPGRSFQTPIATLHAFQGWADKFTTTPGQGVVDSYVTLAGSPGDLTVQLSWHDFSAEAGDREYGRELDASVAYRLTDRYDLLLKAASYSSDGFSSDATKLWLQVSARF